jgi:hypothetical protein
MESQGIDPVAQPSWLSVLRRTLGDRPVLAPLVFVCLQLVIMLSVGVTVFLTTAPFAFYHYYDGFPQRVAWAQSVFHWGTLLPPWSEIGVLFAFGIPLWLGKMPFFPRDSSRQASRVFGLAFLVLGVALLGFEFGSHVL